MFSSCQKNILIVSRIANCREEPKQVLKQVPNKQMTRHLDGKFLIHGVGAMKRSFADFVVRN